MYLSKKLLSNLKTRTSQLVFEVAEKAKVR
jgi:hypothetical protein